VASVLELAARLRPEPCHSVTSGFGRLTLETVADPIQIVPGRQKPLLANAAVDARHHGLSEIPIVDADLHLHGLSDSAELRRYIKNPNLQRLYTSWDSLIPVAMGDRRRSDRTKDPAPLAIDRFAVGTHRTASTLLATMDDLGVDFSVVFHAPLVYLAQHPDSDVETELAQAFARWLVDDVLPSSHRLMTMPYLPITNPRASLRMIEDFGDKPGVVGFLITSVNHLPLHRNEYMKVFAALNERSLPVAFHCGQNWEEKPFHVLESFLGAHALGTPFYGMVHLFNLVISGIPERFPDIKWIFMEAGQTWAAFGASRLDNEYRQRTSEAPLLTKLPSEYIREMFFTTQPLEQEFDSEQARTYFEYLNGAHSFLYSSGFPGPDFDTPTTILNMPYLNAGEKHAILGGNAMRLFNLPKPN
jgi:uncharacterized protein